VGEKWVKSGFMMIVPLHQDCFDDFVDGKSQNHTRI
jgi:hypothetical protein